MALLYFVEPAEIKRKTDDSIKEFEVEQNAIAQLLGSKEQLTWDSTVNRLDNAEGLFCRWLWTCELMAKVMPNPDARKEYNSSISTLKQFLNKTWIRSDLYQVLSRFQDSNPHLDKSQSRLLKTYLNQFIRNGANLQGSQLEKYSQVTQRLTELCVKFLANVNEDTSHVLLTLDQLEGMNSDYVNRLNKDKDLYIVTMKYPDALPALKLCKKEETRKLIQNVFDNRCSQENLPILKEIVHLRQEMAGMLGYKDYPSYVLDVKMAKDLSSVENFVNKIHKKVLPLAKQDIEKLLSYKKKDKQERNEQYEEILNDWDVSYYSNILKEREYGVDDELVRQYFPMNFVLEKMFEIYQRVLGLKFVEKQGEVWHKDVKYYDVFDAKNNERIGSFYLDLYPREGKYSHASAYPVVDGFVSKGTRNYAVATMVANFTQPTATKPSLLTHREVVTLFHEFGHVCHNLCAKATYYRHTWFNVEMDFLEAPSQMLENWVWTKDVLQEISSHFERREPLPDRLIDDIIKAKNMCNGLHYVRQIFFGVFDMELHKSNEIKEPQDISKLWNKLKPEWTLRPACEGTNYAAGFMHLCAGYDCGYYGYLWSEVFSADMFSRFKNEGVLSSVVGEAYRKFILEPGASDDGIVLIRNYLGREPSEEAFLNNVGVAQ